MGFVGSLLGGVRHFRNGVNGAKAVDVLDRFYDLEVTDRVSKSLLKKVTLEFGDIYSTNEIAVHFLYELSKLIEPSNPRAIPEVSKWIRRAKKALAAGSLESDVPLNYLIGNARERFGIDPDKV